LVVRIALIFGFASLADSAVSVVAVTALAAIIWMRKDFGPSFRPR
jgi:hypothetical protein